MKENLRNINERKEEKTKNTRINSANSRTFLKKIVFIYKLVDISKETYENNGAELLVDDNGIL